MENYWILLFSDYCYNNQSIVKMFHKPSGIKKCIKLNNPKNVPFKEDKKFNLKTSRKKVYGTQRQEELHNISHDVDILHSHCQCSFTLCV